MLRLPPRCEKPDSRNTISNSPRKSGIGTAEKQLERVLGRDSRIDISFLGKFVFGYFDPIWRKGDFRIIVEVQYGAAIPPAHRIEQMVQKSHDVGGQGGIIPKRYDVAISSTCSCSCHADKLDRTLGYDGHRPEYRTAIIVAPARAHANFEIIAIGVAPRPIQTAIMQPPDQCYAARNLAAPTPCSTFRQRIAVIIGLRKWPEANAAGHPPLMPMLLPCVGISIDVTEAAIQSPAIAYPTYPDTGLLQFFPVQRGLSDGYQPCIDGTALLIEALALGMGGRRQRTASYQQNRKQKPPKYSRFLTEKIRQPTKDRSDLMKR